MKTDKITKINNIITGLNNNLSVQEISDKYNISVGMIYALVNIKTKEPKDKSILESKNEKIEEDSTEKFKIQCSQKNDYNYKNQNQTIEYLNKLGYVCEIKDNIVYIYNIEKEDIDILYEKIKKLLKDFNYAGSFGIGPCKDKTIIENDNLYREKEI